MQARSLCVFGNYPMRWEQTSAAFAAVWLATGQGASLIAEVARHG